MADGKLKISMVQLKQGRDIEGNIEKALAFLDKAAQSGADIAVLPEMFLCPYEPLFIKKAEKLSLEALDALKNAARKNHMMIVAGSMPVCENEERPFNRSIVINAEGEEIYRHDKMHLFDCSPPGGPAIVESSFTRPGSTLGSFNTKWGKCSVIVCYDIRFTALTHLLGDMGVKMLFIPAAFSTSTGPAHWEMLVRMRAVELQGFVIGVQPAFNSELNYIPYGHSIAAGPFGQVIADAGADETVKTVEIDTDECDKLKEVFPLLKHRRTDLYRTVWLDADRT